MDSYKYGNSDGLIVFGDNEFSTLYDLGCSVWSLCYNEDRLWIGTDCGLKYLENEKVHDIQCKNLSDQVVIKSIIPARNRNFLWLETNNGFAYFDKSLLDIEFSINSKDGLIGGNEK